MPARQLEGIWMDCRSLSSARRRAFVQLVAHYREVEPQRSRLDYLLGDRELDSQAVAMVEDLATCHAHVATVTIALIEKAKRQMEFCHPLSSTGRGRTIRRSG